MTAAVASTFTVAGAPPRATPVDACPAFPTLPATYVHPGQFVVSGEAGVLTTILGSCVSVCLHDRRLRIGGLNHFLLPNYGGTVDTAGRYGPVAIAQLLEGMLANGGAITRMTAQIIGGAAVLAAFGNEKEHLGLRNARFASDMMASHGIPVLFTDIGGNRGRKLMFSPRDGTAHVQLIGR